MQSIGSKSTLSPTNTSAAFVGLAVNDANDRLVAVGVPGTSAVCAYTTDLTLASWNTTSTSITGLFRRMESSQWSILYLWW